MSGRYVWNWALELRTDAYYEEGESVSYTDTSKRLTDRKKEKTWLREVSSVALQQKLRDLDQAFQNFFDGRGGYPNFADTPTSSPNTTSRLLDCLQRFHAARQETVGGEGAGKPEWEARTLGGVVIFPTKRSPRRSRSQRIGPAPVRWTFFHFNHRPRLTMPRTRPPYPEEFRSRIVELARNGRKPSELAEEFEPTEQTIRNWIKQADRDDGKSAEGLSTDERKELRELRKKLRQMKQERDISAK